MSSGPRPIAFLSDYGLEDEFVGICHAVMARISPSSPVIDLTHAIPPQDVLRGALTLHRSLPFLPRNAVVVAVVDPGVGTPRLPIAVETTRHGRLLVGPDNGLLSLAWQREGGLRAAADISSPSVLLEPVSKTFHGRDIFAPAAAHLALGRSVQEMGRSVEPSKLVALSLPAVDVGRGEVATEVLWVDRFGNVQLSARPEDLVRAGMEETPRVQFLSGGRSTPLRRAATFGEVPEGAFALIVNSSGWLAVVLNRGNAGQELSLAVGDAVTLQAPDQASS